MDYRIEYVYTTYRSMLYLGSTQSSQLAAGVVYKFDI